MYSDQEKRKKSYSIRALCDPRNLTMVSVAYTRVDRGRERKIRVRIETKVKEKRIDFESNRNGSNPNPRDERARDLPGLRATAAAGARDVLVSLLAGLHGTEEPPARRSGTLGSRAGGSRAWLRPRPARRRRAHPLASARAGEQAAVAPSRPLRLAVASTPWLPPLTRREKGGRMT